MSNKDEIREKIISLSKGKSVALFGVGISATSAKILLGKLGIESEFYAQGEGKHAEKSVDFKEFTPNDAPKHALVVYSPAFRPDNQWIKTAEESGAMAICETDLSALAFDGKIIAVTGTNGKTTLTSFITHVLNLNARQAIAAGNIGKPLCAFCAEFEETADKIAVYELSSFQTSRIKFLRPDALVWTNFAPDHLDWHVDMQEYFDAKLNLANSLRAQVMYAGSSVLEYAKKYDRHLPDFAKIMPEKNLPTCPAPFDSSVQAQNYTLALQVLANFGITANAVAEAAKTFKLPAFRFSSPIEKLGIRFYNDSKATNAHAAIAALDNLAGKKNLIWLGGGKDKYCSLDDLVVSIKKSAQGAVLIGQTAEKLKNLLGEMPLGVHACQTMEEAVQTSANLAGKGGNVLFSPAFSSFGMFSGYSERGKSFENAVLCLKNLK